MILELENISYQYKNQSDHALKNISASIDSSQITGIAGENGSGKTTLMKILLRRLIDYSGNYKIDKEVMLDYTNSLVHNYKIGYSSDVPVLDDTLTGFEIIEIVNEIRGGTDVMLREDLMVFKEYLGIGDWLHTKLCSDYSAGMRKKVSICVALCGSPRFVILDEPVNALDPISIFGLQNLLLLKKDAGTGILVSSHILHFIEKTADCILLLKSGFLNFCGKLNKLQEKYPQKDLDEIYFTLYHNKQ